MYALGTSIYNKDTNLFNRIVRDIEKRNIKENLDILAKKIEFGNVERD